LKQDRKKLFSTKSVSCFPESVLVLTPSSSAFRPAAPFRSFEFRGLGLADLGRLEHAELKPEEHEDECGGNGGIAAAARGETGDEGGGDDSALVTAMS